MSLLNPLLHPFPRSVKVRGISFPIRWDFLTCFQLTRINNAQDMTWTERLELMLRMFYADAVPEDIDEAVRLMAKFLNCGDEVPEPVERPESDEGEEDEDEDEEWVDTERNPPLYSFERDGGLIYTAILQTYGIDIEADGDTLHWWKFLAMIRDISPQTSFSRLLQLRQRYLSGEMDDAERAAFIAMGPDAMPPEVEPDPDETAAIEAFLAELES